MHEPGSTDSSPPELIDDSESEYNVAEPSSWAERRNRGKVPKLGHCVACGEETEFYKVARIPCGHEYCRPCLAQPFELSMSDESLFPPRCDQQEIQVERVSFFLPGDLIKRYQAAYAELSTKNKVYCHDIRCNKWIPPTSLDYDKDAATCIRCSKTTCVICKGPSHTGDCLDDTALRQLVDTAENSQWQRCYQCTRFVELGTGCNHITYVRKS